MENREFYHELDRLFKTGTLQEAEQFLTSAMERARTDGDLPALLAVANELGGIFRVTGRFGEAQKIYGAALELVGKLGLHNTEQHATTLLNMASIYTEMNDPAEALKLDEQAEKILISAGMTEDYRMAALYNNMSHALEKAGQQEAALDRARRSLSIIRKLKGNDTELATSYTTLGIRCSKAGRHAEAAEYLAAAVKLYSSQPGKPDVHYAAALNALGELSYKTGKREAAVSFFEQALKILKENYGENQSFREVSKNLERAKSSDQNKTFDASKFVMTPEQTGRMSGLALSEAYYNEFGKPMIEREFADYKKYIAAGLVGEGSECFGFDDEKSESHDFGPGFCIWIPEELELRIGRKLREEYEKLPKSYGNHCRIETEEGRGRVGVFSIGMFYRKYIGCQTIPSTNVEWLYAPETSYATATNGKIFEDNLGAFSKIRQSLLDFYPRDVLLKKLSARIAMMSQAGQYNYMRCMQRTEYGAAYLACSEFIRNTTAVIYLLNRCYMPFYKWMFRGMDRLTVLPELKGKLEQLAALPDRPEHAADKVRMIEEICLDVANELRKQGFIQGSDDFLNNHCSFLMNQIRDEKIRSLPVMFDAK